MKCPRCGREGRKMVYKAEGGWRCDECEHTLFQITVGPELIFLGDGWTKKGLK